jgi:hypothetical protein
MVSSFGKRKSKVGVEKQDKRKWQRYDKYVFVKIQFILDDG